MLSEEEQIVTEGQVIFLGLDHFYNEILSFEDQLLCKQFEKEAGHEQQYDILLKSLSSFQNKLRALTTKAKQRQVAKIKQSTFYCAFTKK